MRGEVQVLSYIRERDTVAETRVARSSSNMCFTTHGIMQSMCAFDRTDFQESKAFAIRDAEGYIPHSNLRSTLCRVDLAKTFQSYSVATLRTRSRTHSRSSFHLCHDVCHRKSITRTRKALFREISNTASNLRTARFQARSPRPSRPAASTAFAVSLIFGEATSMTAVTLSCIAAESLLPLSCRKRCAAEATESSQAIDFDFWLSDATSYLHRHRCTRV